MPPITRRAALAGGLLGGALVLTGCSDVRFVTGPETTPTARRGPDDDARDALVAQSLDLLARASGLARSQPAAQAVVDACAAHLTALGEDEAGVTSTPAQDAPAAVVGQELTDALATAAGGAMSLLAGTGPATARLAVSIGASRAVLLDGLAAALPVTAPPVALPLATTAPTSPTADTRSAVDALQRALAGEHAAVHAYGLVLGRLAGARRDEAYGDLGAHRVARDDLVDLLVAGGAVPVGAPTSYDAAAATPEAAELLAASVEDRLAGVYADVVVAGTRDRVTGADGVLRSARTARRWGSSVVSFPGMVELAADGTPASAPGTGLPHCCPR